MALRNLKGDLGHQLCGDSSNRLQRSMAVIFSKYDKDFPESDIINLEDLSISDDRGFLKRLPKEPALWNSNLLEEGNSPELHGGPDLDAPSKDLSTTALDMFLEEVISEECQHGNIKEVQELFQREDSGDLSDDIASIASGMVTKDCDDVNLVEEDDDTESSADDERLDRVADKPFVYCEESLDRMTRVEAWLKGGRKRKAISKDDGSLVSKACQLRVSKKCGEDVDGALAQEGTGRSVFIEKNKPWQGNIKTTNSGKGTSSRKHILRGDSPNLVANVAALESSVSGGATCTSSEHLESPVSRILIESWKLSVLKLCHQDLTSKNNQCLSRKQCAVSPRSSLSLVTQPYHHTSACSDDCKCRRSYEVSTSDTQHQHTDDDDDDNDDDFEQEGSLTVNGNKETRTYSFSQQYLQDFNKNFCKRKNHFGWIDSLNSNGVNSSIGAVNVISRGHKVIDGQLQNRRMNERSLDCKKRSVSSQHTLTSSGSDGEYKSSLISEVNREKQKSEAVNSFCGKVQNNELAYKTGISDTRWKTLNPQSEEVGVKGSRVLNGSHGLQTSPSYEYAVMPLLENSLEDGEDVSFSFVPSHSSTMINSTPLAALHECTLKAEYQEDSKNKGKMNKHKVQSKHHPAKDLPSGVEGNEGAITGRVKRNTRLVLQRENYHCSADPISSTVDKANSTDGHFVKKEDFLNPIPIQKGINKAFKLPSGKSCGGPSKCKKVFCLDCCHSPCV